MAKKTLVPTDLDLSLPDAWPLPETGLEAFAAACLPVLPTPETGSQRDERIRYMAQQLHLLELDCERVLFVCSLADWPWVREAYRRRAPYPQAFGRPQMPSLTQLAEDSLYFLLGELPYLTFLYEHRRAEEIAGRSGGQETIDGVKILLIEARDRAPPPWAGLSIVPPSVVPSVGRAEHGPPQRRPLRG